MKKTNLLFLLSSTLFLTLSSCAVIRTDHSHSVDSSYIDEQGNLTEPIDIARSFDDEPHDAYNEGVVLVKTVEDFDYKNIGVGVKEVEELYPGSLWKKITLKDIETVAAVKALRKSGLFDKVDYDYIMKNEAEIEAIDVSSNTYAGELPYIESNGVGNAWAWGQYKHNHGEEQIYAGGSPDVVVAVIDTGVDYNHIDLRNNIWTNTGEIPNNGVDDDHNGYVDDVHGWDCVNEDNDPIDDNGHGTHVAGIVAAENNSIGTVGVAFNCKVMPVKAGSSRGSFANADIAQAIQYAYMNGASVINMSFGGLSISMAVEDALSDAYNQCVLVAAAGNSAMCSEPNCAFCFPNCAPCYPGSLPYVVGVMSCNSTGSSISSFSNYDHNPFHYNQHEYDCYACGEQITSLWPNNKFARLSGTSMASPVVAGIAALMRSAYPDRDTYSSKYIHSQLTNTGTIKPAAIYGTDIYHPVCDAYEALTKIPAPHIYNLYNYYAFDSVELSPNNNGDGFIDAGERIRLGIELQNRGGKATNVTAKIDTIVNNDPDLRDPNITIVEDTVHMNEIGTYSIQDGGKIYGGDKVVGMENAFVVDINPNTQNGYVCNVNLHISYYNGLENDNIEYKGDCTFTLTVNSGVYLSGIIEEDTLFTNEKSYTIADNLVIPEGVTVRFEQGCKLNFYSVSQGYIDSTFNTPTIDVFGSLYFDGTEDEMIVMRTNPLWEEYGYTINAKSAKAVIELNYVDSVNLFFNMSSSIPDDGNDVAQINVRHSFCDFYTDGTIVYRLDSGTIANYACYGNYSLIEDSKFDISNASGINFYIRKAVDSLFIYGSGRYANGFTFTDLHDHVSDSTLSSNNLFAFENVSNNKTGTPYGISFAGTYYDKTIKTINNNAFVNTDFSSELSDYTSINLDYDVAASKKPHYEDNYFDSMYRNHSNLIVNNYNSQGLPLVNPSNSGNFDGSLVWPYIQDISILNDDEEVVRTVGTETNKVRVTFSAPMDITNSFSLFYGSWEPYADYEIRGDYVSETVWEGTLKVKANIEGGIQHFSSKGGCAKNDSFKTLLDNSEVFTFNIDTSSAYAMNLQANATEEGVELNWVQDDYDTLMGYNIYRSTDKDGNFIRINPSIVPAGESTFFDDSCEPGQNYWYTFTVVLSDFSESAPAGKVNVTAIDTVNPVIYHTPVNQGYTNNNLVINCTASDNIAVTSGTLYYRTVGEEEWKTIPMSKLNDRFSATIFGSEITLVGIEYYISVTDGRNIITRGSADSPYTVVIKDASTLNNIGDVDGDGSITTRDALMIMQSINGDLLLTDDQFQRADLNKDEQLSSVEALRILQYINGKVNTLEM